MRRGPAPTSCNRSRSRARGYSISRSRIWRTPRRRDSQVEVGKGVLDIPSLFRALGRPRLAGHVSLEYEINESAPEVGMKESLAYMRGVADALVTT
jgi:sugar phosphate isomerase/epimerase